MAIILDENTTVVVQGMTGREGSLRTKYMQDYGTKVRINRKGEKGKVEIEFYSNSDLERLLSLLKTD